MGIISLNPEYVLPISGMFPIGKFKFEITGITIPTNHDMLSVKMINIVPTDSYLL